MVAAISGQLLVVADTVAREKGVEKEEILDAMETGIAKAARQKFGYEYDIRAEIDRKSGDVTLRRFIEVVPDDMVELESSLRQMRLAEAKKQDAALEVGQFIVEPLPEMDFGRIAAQSARQVIRQKVNEASRRREFEEYKDKTGEIVSGIIKRKEFGSITIDLGRAEAILRRDEQMPRENLRPGDRVRAYVYDIRRDNSGPQIYVSRTHPQFLAKLFEQEVPEVYEGVIEIKAVARDPGSRAKIAVHSTDSSIDPRGACIGMRGSRVQAVKAELQDENIDVIKWSEDPATFIIDALYPAEVRKIVFDEEQRKVDVVVPDENLSLAIGRRGQNVRLASMLSGWHIDLMTEAQESEHSKKEIETYSAIFMAALDVDDVIARLLATEGFHSIEEIAFIPIEDLAGIQGFDTDIATELQNRAKQAFETAQKKIDDRLEELKVAPDLLTVDGLSKDVALKIAEKGIRTRDDLADLSTGEFLDMLEEKTLTKADAEKIIMAARAHWFTDDAAAPQQTAAGS